jgi:hypothetical protein
MDDVFMLAGGRAIKRSRYDHATGKFTPPETVDPKQVLLISGLHTLYIRELRNLLNLKIYLDPDSAVCAAWKTARDTAERSYTREEVLAQISSRAGDEEKFIKPQRKNADLVFSFRLRDAADAGKYAGTREESLLELSVTAGSSLDCNDLIERLERTPSLKLAIEYTGGDADPQTTMTVSGLIGAGEVFSIASSVIPNLHELAGLAAAWKPGLLGLQQLMTVMAISQALRRHELSLPAPVSQMPDAGNV